MAIVIEIDEKGNRIEKLGGIASLRDALNVYAAEKLICTSLYLRYQPKNYQVMRIIGRYTEDNAPFEAESSPVHPDVPLHTILIQMADELIRQRYGTGASNAIPAG